MDFAYVVLPADSNAHRLAEDEQTACGLPIPINGGADLFVAVPEGDQCPDCFPESTAKRSKGRAKA